jgi:uncharacterized membrane protein
VVAVDIGVEEAMKLIVSGGFYSPPEKNSGIEIASKKDRMMLKESPKVPTV